MGKDQELLEAARNGNIAVVEKILGQKAKRSGPLASLRRGPGANVQDSSGYSSLHHAALNGHREIVRLLLAHEASTNIVDVKGSSPLHLAAWTGNVDVVRLLLCHGPSVPNVNLTTKDNETALHSAAQYGHAAVVAQLLEHGCDPLIRNSRQETALDLAAQYGRLETVELLIRTHPELIEPMRRAYSSISFSHTPLHLASRNGHKSVVEVLLSAGVDVNIRTSAGTALHEAALCGKVEVVRTLLDHGVDLHIKDKQENTVMDLLNQFPAHVTQETVNLIKRYRGSHVMDCDMDPDRESLSQSLPPIPVPDSTLGSPYENVRPSSRGRTRTGQSASPNSTSPSRWDFYRQSKSVDDAIDDRRKSGASALSLSSDNSYYQNSPAPKSFMDPCFHSSEEYPSSMYRQRDSDQISISSTASSTGGMTSSRDRDHRQTDNSSNNIYLPMGGPRSSAHSPGSNNKVSPTPPKKPPRRNLSVSPTHLTPMSMSADSTNAINSHAYEYLFLARSGARSQGDLEEIGSRTLQHGRSVDTYVEMNKRFSIAPQDHTLLQRGRSEELVLDDYNKDAAPGTPITNSNQRLQPVAITAVYENVAIKTQNPRRKLRRHHDVYENFELRHSDPVKNTSSTPNITENVRLSTFVSNAYIMLKSSEESLLIDEHRNNSGDVQTQHGGSPHHTKQLKRVTQLQQQQQQTPTSPTHYKQPPTPDHPPPTPMQAENTIHDRIRPLSQEYKRRSRDIETETDEDFLMFPALDESSGSLSSSISLSDRSISTDNNVEEFVCDVPFAGLFKGSTTALDGVGGARPVPAERPKTLRRLKNVYDTPTANINGNNEPSSRQHYDDESPQECTVTKRTKNSNNSTSSSQSTTSQSNNDKDKSLSILSPFDEQEEWAKISEIMASIGTGLVRESVFVTELEQEFQARLGLSCSQNSLSNLVITPIGQWLSTLGLAEFESVFLNNGYDDIDFINGVLEENDLREMGITNEEDRTLILNACKQLSYKIEELNCKNFNNNNLNEPNDSVEQWLQRINLQQYSETFRKHLYLDMERVRRIWEIELTAVLEIHKIGHRKRILASVSNKQNGVGPNLDEIHADLHLLETNIQQLKEDIHGTTTNSQTTSIQSSNTNTTSFSTANQQPQTNTGTLRHNHKKNRPAPQPPGKSASDLRIRAPSELLVGVPATLRTQWRHKPTDLVVGSINYVANYLGSTVVKELRGTESTKKSIQKLKKSTSKDQKILDIILSISYRGVKFLNTLTRELVCEHEIRNIHCACQDADDLTHFAYITKDHATQNHFCHVFCVQTMAKATEIILTLGQAFEVAYQMALREQQVGNKSGHTRSQSANQLAATATSPSDPHKTLSNGIGPPTSSSSTNQPPVTHARSHSVNEIKLNGHQLSLAPALSMSTEDFTRSGDLSTQQQQQTPSSQKASSAFNNDV